MPIDSLLYGASAIDIAQRRNDLIGNLVETVKGTAIQEQEVFGHIADARAALAGGNAKKMLGM